MLSNLDIGLPHDNEVLTRVRVVTLNEYPHRPANAPSLKPLRNLKSDIKVSELGIIAESRTTLHVGNIGLNYEICSGSQLGVAGNFVNLELLDEPEFCIRRV